MTTPGIPPAITVSGIGSIPQGYILGRVSPGVGPVQLLKFSDITQSAGAGKATNSIAQGGSSLPAFTANGQILTLVGGIPAWANPALTLSFVMGSGATGTNVGPELISPRPGNFTKLKVVTKASDPTTDLTFKLRQNGSIITGTTQTIVHGTTAGTISSFTVAITVAQDDLFTIDITSGTTNWQVTVQLET